LKTTLLYFLSYWAATIRKAEK